MKKLLLFLCMSFVFTHISLAQNPSAGEMHRFIVYELQDMLNGYQISLDGTPADAENIAILQIPHQHNINTVMSNVNRFVRDYSDVHYSDSWSEFKDGYASIIIVEEIEAYYLIYYVESSNRVLITYMRPNNYRTI